MEGQFPKCPSVRVYKKLTDFSLEAYLTIRAQEYLASLGQAQSNLTAADLGGLDPAEVRLAFAPGAGMDGAAPIAPSATPVRQKGPRR